MEFGISYREHTLFLPYWIYSYSLSLFTPPVYQFILTVTSQIILHLSALWNPRRSQKEKKKRKEKTKGGKKRKKTFGKNKQTKNNPKSQLLGVWVNVLARSLWGQAYEISRQGRPETGEPHIFSPMVCYRMLCHQSVVTRDINWTPTLL